ncbi:MAG: FHA domain-containing protein [Fimbriimonadaceae bacterium]|nr:FHA domain-containing protein [Fimbriimonadaceae bacterium]
MSPRTIAVYLFAVILCMSVVAQSGPSNTPETNAPPSGSGTPQERRLTIVLPNADGEYIAWVQSDAGRFVADRGMTASEGKIVLPVIGDVAGQSVYVADRKSNSIASVGLAEVKDNLWTLKSEDFRNIFEVVIRVEHEGTAVRDGQVVGRVGTLERTALVTEDDKGRVSLFNLPTGEMQLSFTTKIDGTEQTIAGPTVGIVKSPNPSAFVMEISEAVPVVEEDKPGEPVATANTPAPAATPNAGGSPIGQMITGLIALGIVGAIGWWAWKNHRAKIEEGLKAMGVPMDSQPSDSDDEDSPHAPAYSRNQPIEQIVLNPVPMDPAVSAPVQVPIAAAIPNPRLVSSSGQVQMLGEESIEVGRDAVWLIGAPSLETASRRHASFARVDGGIVVSDLGSTNGTYVNGQKIEGPVTLSPGDVVQLGGLVLRYEE